MTEEHELIEFCGNCTYYDAWRHRCKRTGELVDQHWHCIDWRGPTWTIRTVNPKNSELKYRGGE